MIFKILPLSAAAAALTAAHCRQDASFFHKSQRCISAIMLFRQIQKHRRVFLHYLTPFILISKDRIALRMKFQAFPIKFKQLRDVFPVHPRVRTVNEPKLARPPFYFHNIEPVRCVRKSAMRKRLSTDFGTSPKRSSSSPFMSSLSLSVSTAAMRL